MDDNDIKILTHGNRTITLKELYEEHERSHREQAKLPFEEKIKILVQMQKLARDWGGISDIFVWQIE